MDIFEILVDPLDHSALQTSSNTDGDVTQIRSQSRQFRITNGHPDLTPDPLPPALAARQDLWNKLQENGAFTYDADPHLNLSTDDDFVQRFQSITKIKGRVLDIGCGPQVHHPRYLESAQVSEMVGIDPLAGAQKRDFPFVIGISETLPFVSNTFDAVVFCRSLDHVLDTQAALRDAMRVLCPGGRLCIVMDLMQQERKGALARLAHLMSRGFSQFYKSMRAHGLFHAVQYIGALAALKVPEGAEDMFHMHFPSVEEVEGILRKTGSSDIQFHDLSDDETICIALK